MGLGSGSRDRVIVELGPEGRPGPGFCQVAGQAHIKVSWTGMVWQAEHKSILLLWHMGTGGILGTTEELWACPSHEQSICLWLACSVSILFFVNVSTRGQPGKGDELLASCMGLSGLGCFSKITLEKC